MSFNKGDFTQQGVAGHVNAILRLNEKRLVNIDMTSNEEAEGCTIAGTVTDLLNDKVYNIGSGGGTLVSLTATENGEYDPADFDADGFSDVTVNVAGGGDFTTAQLTYTGTPTTEYIPLAINVPEYELLGSYGKLFPLLASPVTVILYKGKAYAELDDVQSISGNITYDSDMSMYTITGDCTVNFGGGAG